MTDVKAVVSYDHFAALDLRVGRIVAVEAFPAARNPSWKLRIDLGALGEKQSSAQITNYTTDQLLGTQVVCVCNFAPRNIAGFQSEVLILGAAGAAGEVIVLSPRSEAPPGAIVY